MNQPQLEELACFCAALCLLNMQPCPAKSLVLAAQNTMANQCALDILRAFSLPEMRP